MSDPKAVKLEVKTFDPKSQKSEEMKEDALKPKGEIPPNPELEETKKDEVCLFFWSKNCVSFALTKYLYLPSFRTTNTPQQLYYNRFEFCTFYCQVTFFC